MTVNMDIDTIAYMVRKLAGKMSEADRLETAEYALGQMALLVLKEKGRAPMRAFKESREYKNFLQQCKLEKEG